MSFTFNNDSLDDWTAVAAGTDTRAGVSFFPLNSTISDNIAFLDIDTATGFATERVLSVDYPPGYGAPTPIAVASPVAPPGVGNGFYHRDPNAVRSVFSHYDGFSFNTWAWKSSLTPLPLPISDPIHDLLTTGELYHRGGEEDTVYGFDGSKRYEFPAGSLRFAYETFDDPGGAAIPMLYYTLIYWESGGDGGDDQLYIRVYKLPTADLDKLD
jgi:hypothetical protein